MPPEFKESLHRRRLCHWSALGALRLSAPVALLLSSAPALSKPLEIDLAPERQEYEAKKTARLVGILSAGAAAAGTAMAGYGYVTAFGIKGQLLAETVPVNPTERNQLFQGGMQANALGVVGLSVLVVAGIAAAIFLGSSL